MKAIITYTKDWDDKKEYECEIESLQDLIDIHNKEKENLIISTDEGVLCIEVYDDYRE